MKRLVVTLLAVLLAVTAMAQKPKKFYEYTYHRSCHFVDGKATPEFEDSKLKGSKIYLIYNPNTDSFSYSDKEGVEQIPDMINWDEEAGYYYGTDYYALLLAVSLDEYCISKDAEVMFEYTMDDEEYDVRNVYFLTKVTNYNK